MREFLARYCWLAALLCLFCAVANILCIYFSPKVIDYSYAFLAFMWGMILAIPLVQSFYKGLL